MAKTFEEQISELEGIVSELEKGEVGLDKSLELFEQGIKLTKSCQKVLDTAERKVKVLLSDANGEMAEEDFENE
ncbi:MAG: exodeoxyribonuclease VII small subunit [Clostridia bacterium]|nr:exodeoxyribonuclease VII small subunit [Clostridia bacterium]